MAGPMTPRELEQLADKLEPSLRRAFLKAVQEATDAASLRMLTELVEAGRADLVAEALGLNAARFADLFEAIRAAYLQSGLLAALEVPPLASSLTLGNAGRQFKIPFRFDITNPEAERWLRGHSSSLVSQILEDQRDNIRVTLTQGAAAGRGPRQTALDIVGRIGTTGRRTGGTLGLTAQQVGFVANMRAELSDPQAMAGYFTRTRRDKRFDATVRKAMREGRALSPAEVDKIVGRYADRLLQLRGEAIARSETLTAMNAARFESYRQAIEVGGMDPRNVVATWGASGDSRTRHSHAAMNGQRRVFGQPFTTPRGARMRYPGDTGLGAGPEETINCRCMVTWRVDYAAEAVRA